MRYEDASGAFQASGPVANDDADTLAAGSRGPATGNLISGEGTQYGGAGADSAAGAQVAAIAGQGGEDSSFSAGKLSVAGAFGQLTVDAEGNYSYLANDGAPENVRDRFTYTLADSEGNTDTAALIVEIGKTPAVIRADAQQIVPGPDGVITLPPGVELSDIMVVGRNLVVNMPDGTQLIIVDGAVFVPQLVLGGVEVPATNVATLLIGQEPQPAAGETPPSSGGNFALPPPPLDPGVPLGDLLPPTEYDYTPPEPQEVFEPLDREPEILVQPENQIPSIAAIDSVDEAGLPARNGGEPEGSGEGADGNPSNDSDASEATAGTILINSPDGVESVTINGVLVTGVVGQEIQGEHGTLTITGFSGDNILYSYVLDDNTSGDDTQDDFALVLTDSDGDVASATLTIEIIDDVPTARPDTDTLGIGENTATGNVMTDASPGDVGDTDSDAADTVGADGATLTSVSGAGGSDSSFEAGVLVVNGQFGVLTIDAAGNYTYTRNEDAPGGVTDVFNYTITDGDGDTSSSTLTINIPDQFPDLPNPDAVLLDDDALANGNPGGTGDDVDSQGTPGQLAGSGGDGDLDYNFTGVDTLPAGFTTNLVDASTLQILQGGTVVLTVTLDNETGAFTVVQNNPIDHPAGGDENNLQFGIGVEVEDSDGDTDPATITINVDDDTPVVEAVLDSEGAVTVDESGPTAASTITIGEGIAKGDDENVAGSGPIGRAVGSTAVVDATALFGADGPSGSGLTYSLQLGSSDTPLTLTDGSAIELQLIDGVVVGVVTEGAHVGEAAFAIAINPATGVATVELYLSVDHPVNPDPNDALPLGPDTVSVVVTATDGDGDTAGSDPVDISGLFEFRDDGPSIDPELDANATVTVDESLPSDDPGINTGEIVKGNDPDLDGGVALGQANSGVAIVDANALFGADGPAAADSIVYALSITNPDAGVTLTDGTPINLMMVGGVIVGVVDGGTFDGQAAFAIAIDPDTGVVTVEQYLSLDHPVNPDPNDPLGLGENSVAVTVTATDGDGDPVTSDAIDISSQITFLDDGPSADPVLEQDATVTVDESLPSVAEAINTPGIVKGDDPDLAGGLAIGSGNSGVAVIDVNAFFGADGPAAGGGVGYELSILNASSGLTLTDGSAIELQLLANGVVVGVVDGGTFDGQAAFAIAIDPSTGVVTVEQYLSLDHPVNPDPNDPLGLGENTLGVTATITDGDGDSITTDAIDISDQITFLDDGPTAEVDEQAELDTLVLDETTPPGTETDGDSDPAGLVTTTANFADNFSAIINYGADGPGSVSYSFVLDGEDVASGLYAVDSSDMAVGTDGDGYGQGSEILLNASPDGLTITGSVGTDDYFTISIDPVTGVVTFTQLDNVWHANTGSDDDTSALMAAIGSLLVRQTVVDGDGDSATADIDISQGVFEIEDDGPVATDDVDEIVAGGETAEGNVLTGEGTNAGLANADDVGADQPGRISQVSGFGGTDAVFEGGFLEIAGQYGTLKIDADGNYSYTRSDGGAGDVQDIFTYTLIDADGDTDTGTLTINIGDAAPNLPDPATVLLDDDALANGNPGGVGDDVDQAGLPGQLAGTGGDGDLDYNFTALDNLPLGFTANHVDGSTVQILQGATIVLTITLNNESGAFNVVQNNPIDHLAGDNENNYQFSIGVEVEDADGDKEPAAITINVDDDTPVLQNVTAGGSVDVDETDAGSPGDFPISDTSTDPVIDADMLFGADGQAAVNSIVYGLTIVGGSPEPSGLSTAIGDHPITLVQIDADTIEGQYEDGGTQLAFTIQINPDGTVTLTQEVPLEHLQDGGIALHNDTLDLDGLINATVTITDGDGDSASASAPIGDNLVFFDDGPSAAVDGEAALDQLVLDETRPVGEDSDSGDSDPAGLATVQANFADNFVSPVDFGGDGAGTASYSLVLSANGVGSGLFALDNSDTTTGDGDGYGQGVEITLSQTGNTITGSVGTDDYFTITIDPVTGVVTFTQLANIWHSNTASDDDTSSLMAEVGSLLVQQTVTDSDGDTATADLDISQGVFHIEDDGPEIIAVDNELTIDNDASPSGEGVFDFDIGTDAPNGANDDISLSGFGISVNGVPVGAADMELVEGPEDATTASYSFSFDYDTGNGGTATAEGTLVFNKVDGTYEVELTSGPIEGFSVVSTAEGSTPVFYNNEHIGIVEVADGLFMQFTGYSGATGPSPFGHDDVFTGTSDDVHISSTQIGVHGNALQDNEVVDFEFMTSDPGAVDAPPGATASTAFVQLGQFNTSNPEDVVIVLKLADPSDPANFITRTIVVEGTDIIANQADVPAGFPVLGTNEAIIIISPEDYLNLPGVPAGYEIAGMQIRPSTEGLPSAAGEVYNFDGDLGEFDNSVTDFSGTSDNDVLKIVNIGAVIESTEDQSATISFDVTIHDADGDSQTESITINVGSPPAELLAATSFSSQEQQLQKTAANSNTLTMAAAVAAAGMAETAAAAPTDTESLETFDASATSYSSQVVEKLVVDGEDGGAISDPASSDLSGAEAGPGNSSGHASGTDMSGEHRLDASSSQPEASEAPASQSAEDQGPAANADVQLASAPTVAMVSAEALQAAGLDGQSSANGSVEQVLADALGHGAAPTVDDLLAGLSGGIGGVPELAQLASHDSGFVPGWDMASHAVVGAGFDMMFKVDVATHHQDAIQPAVNG